MQGHDVFLESGIPEDPGRNHNLVIIGDGYATAVEGLMLEAAAGPSVA